MENKARLSPLIHCAKDKSKIKGISIGKEKVIFIHNMIFDVENPKES